MEITLQDVQAYVATKSPDEEVGRPGYTSYCLVANTLRWKYKDILSVRVHMSNTYAFVVRAGEQGYKTIQIPNNVEQLADRFDSLNPSKGINRSELEQYMPELFETSEVQ